MNGKTSPRLWIAFGIGIVAVAGLGLLLVLPSCRPGSPTPMGTPVSPMGAPTSPMASPTSPGLDENPVVASINGRPIRYATWLRAVWLDQVLSGLAGQPAPTSDETIQRLINEELVLEAFPPERSPTPDQIEEEIAKLEKAWEVNDEAVVTALRNAGLIRADLERAIARMLTVQAALEALESEGHETTTWLEEQWESAEIVINEEFRGAAVPYTPPQSPLAPPDALSPIPTPIPAPETPSTGNADDADLALPEIAPDFTLMRAGGDRFTLADQLTQGPVVLVFFQKCG